MQDGPWAESWSRLAAEIRTVNGFPVRDEKDVPITCRGRDGHVPLGIHREEGDMGARFECADLLFGIFICCIFFEREKARGNYFRPRV